MKVIVPGLVNLKSPVSSVPPNLGLAAAAC